MKLIGGRKKSPNYVEINIHFPKVDIVIHTDASQIGSGATNGNNPTRGKWLENLEYHNNYFELKVIFLAVRAYQRYWRRNRHPN